MEYIKQGQAKDKSRDRDLELQVGDILRSIRAEGDLAVKNFTEKYDGIVRQTYRVSPEEVELAYKLVSKELVEGMKLAKDHIEAFARAQLDQFDELKEFKVSEGIYLGHRLVAVDSCLAYVPGGNYPLFSTALMLIIPAKVAGVSRIVASSPAEKETGSINPATLVAMDMAGADEIYAIGGVQAIGAFSYGTASIDPVDCIVGPGNQYVQEAKRQVYGQVGIDFIAGPSEVVIFADSSGDEKAIAADLLAQSEHDRQAKACLVSTSKDLLLAVGQQVEDYLKTLDTAEVAREAWENNGILLYVEDLAEGIDYINQLAPEHLEIILQTPFDYRQLKNYGSLFIGPYSAEVFGDYSSGSNHTLPTSGAARYTGGVSPLTFLKLLTHQQLTREGFDQINKATQLLAEAEGLTAHSLAAKVRERLE